MTQIPDHIDKHPLTVTGKNMFNDFLYLFDDFLSFVLIQG